MNLIVVDASVAGRWCLPGEDDFLSERAFAFLREYARGALRLIVPDLFWAEITLWKARRQGRIGTSAAKTALRLRACNKTSRARKPAWRGSQS